MQKSWISPTDPYVFTLGMFENETCIYHSDMPLEILSICATNKWNLNSTLTYGIYPSSEGATLGKMY